MKIKFLKYIILPIFFSLTMQISNSYIYGNVINKNFVDIESDAAVVIDYNTGRVLFEKNANEKHKMASLTKIMTSILLVENCSLDELIEVPAEATYIGGSTVGLKKGDKVTAKALLYGMLLPSGNDCAYTVALHIGKTIENFADLMDKKALEMGITDTNFSNPHGLDNDEHYTSAKSMAIITKYALNNKYINEIVQTESATINFGSFTKTLNNTNALLRTYSKADGVKTGFTNGANRCLSASATEGDLRLIAIILGAQTTKIRFSEAIKILEASFEKYELHDISSILNFYINIPVIKGNVKYYDQKISANMEIPLTEEEYDNIYIKQDIIKAIYPPLSAGTYIGNIKVMIEDEVLYETKIYLKENIYKKSIKDYFNEALKNIFNERQNLA